MNIEYDIKEILTDIKQSINKLDVKLDKVTEDVGELKTHLVQVEAELKGEIKVLDGKIDGISKRLDTQEFINRGVIVGLLLTILGGFIKLFGLK